MLVNSSFAYSPILVLAEEVKTEEISEYEMMIKQESENNETELDSSFEKKLNNAGFLDCEINDFDKEYVDILKNSKSTKVYVNYVAIDQEEMKNVKTSDDLNERGKVLDEEEVDELISETYDFEEEESLVSKTMSLLGLKPMEVYAYDNFRTPSLDVTSTAYLRQSIGVTEFKRNGITYVAVNYTATWLIEPSNCYCDLAAISWSGGARFTTDFAYKATYMATRVTKSCTLWGGYQEKTDYLNVDITKRMEGRIGLNSLGVTFNLDRTSPYREIYSGSYYGYYINNQRISVLFYLRKGSDGSNSAEYFTMNSQYFHQVKNVGIDGISISADTSGNLGVSMSASVHESYQNAGIQCHLDYKFK
jgi:hypothetical protein